VNAKLPGMRATSLKLEHRDGELGQLELIITAELTQKSYNFHS
jgi:hypothetical protein